MLLPCISGNFLQRFFSPKSFPSSFSPPFPFQSLKSAQLKESSRERKGEGGERRRRREKASEKFTCSEGATIREKKRNFEIAPPPLRWSYTQEKELPLPPPLKKKKERGRLEDVTSGRQIRLREARRQVNSRNLILLSFHAQTPFRWERNIISNVRTSRQAPRKVIKTTDLRPRLEKHRHQSSSSESKGDALIFLFIKKFDPLPPSLARFPTFSFLTHLFVRYVTIVTRVAGRCTTTSTCLCGDDGAVPTLHRAAALGRRRLDHLPKGWGDGGGRSPCCRCCVVNTDATWSHLKVQKCTFSASHHTILSSSPLLRLPPCDMLRSFNTVSPSAKKKGNFCCLSVPSAHARRERGRESD